jgi:hypothetical protein
MTGIASHVADSGGMVLRVLSAYALGARPLTLMREGDTKFFEDCVFRLITARCREQVQSPDIIMIRMCR